MTDRQQMVQTMRDYPFTIYELICLAERDPKRWAILGHWYKAGALVWNPKDVERARQSLREQHRQGAA